SFSVPCQHRRLNSVEHQLYLSALKRDASPHVSGRFLYEPEVNGAILFKLSNLLQRALVEKRRAKNQQFDVESTCRLRFLNAREKWDSKPRWFSDGKPVAIGALHSV